MLTKNITINIKHINIIHINNIHINRTHINIIHINNISATLPLKAVSTTMSQPAVHPSSPKSFYRLKSKIFPVMN